MKLRVSFLSVLILSTCAAELPARGPRGGGRAGGAARSMPSRSISPSINRSPSMSRSFQAPSINRPSPNINRQLPSANRQFPSTNRQLPNTNRQLPNNCQLPSTNRQLPSNNRQLPSNNRQLPNLDRSNSFPRTLDGNRINSGGSRLGDRNTGTRLDNRGNSGLSNLKNYNRPNENQLNDFLNLPKKPAVTDRTGGSKKIETPGGSTIRVGGGKGSVTTPGGKTIGGAGGGVAVRGPDGQLYARGRGVVGGTDGNSAFVRGGSATVARGKNGNTYTKTRSVSAIRDPRGNVLASGKSVQTYNGWRVSQTQFVAVRRSFRGYRWYYTPTWYARYPRAWVATGIVARSWWYGAYWVTAADYCSCWGDPVSYDYGQTIVYQEGSVYINNEPVATAEEYYEEAVDLAATGDESENDEWMALGVFAIVKDEKQESSDRILQLAVNKEGVIRGNFFDELNDQAVPIIGAVDKETQRVAFHPEDRDAPVVDCGLYNLTQNSLPILVHFDKNRTEERVLIRLDESDAPQEDAE